MPVKALLLYAAASVVLVAAAAWLLTLAFGEPAERRAILVSAAIALAIQLPAFALLRAVKPRQAMSAFAVGALLRMLALVLYALVGVRATGLPADAALVSLATFLFVSTLLEPPMLSV